MAAVVDAVKTVSGQKVAGFEVTGWLGEGYGCSTVHFGGFDFGAERIEILGGQIRDHGCSVLVRSVSLGARRKSGKGITHVGAALPSAILGPSAVEALSEVGAFLYGANCRPSMVPSIV